MDVNSVSSESSATLPHFAANLVDKVLESVLCKHERGTPPLISSNPPATEKHECSSSSSPYEGNTRVKSRVEIASPDDLPLAAGANAANKSGTTSGARSTQQTASQQHQTVAQPSCSTNNYFQFPTQRFLGNLPDIMTDFIYFGPGPAKLPQEVSLP